MINNPVDKILQENMSIYGTYIITSRALPNLLDGLKPVQRRILYSMYLNKNFNFTKSAKIEGNTMALHPHGGCYGSMVNMVQKERLSLPLIVGKGNYGSYLSRDIEAAAPRYTEAKLGELAKVMLEETKPYMVNFRPNYDGTLMEPEVLVTRLPLVLFNPNSGIALGMSSSIGSFNVNETIDALIKYIKTNEQTILVPDFPTGGMIIENKEIFENINKTGIGTVRIRAKYRTDGQSIEIYELPYGVTKEAVIDKIAALVKSGKIKTISGLNDLTGLKGMCIEIICKRGTDPHVLMQQLYNTTPLEGTFSFNMNMIYNGLPKVYGTWDVLTRWYKWRKECLVKYTQNSLEKDLKNLEILYGLQKVLLDIDKTIQIIRFSEENEIISKLMKEFDITENQANHVADMKIRNINQAYILKKISSIKELENLIEDKKDIISNELRQGEMIVKDLEAIKKQFGVERKTEIGQINEILVQKVKIAKKKEEEAKDMTPSFICITADGYVKKLAKDCDYSDHKLKEGDDIVGKFPATNSDELLVFAGTECYKLQIKHIPFCKPNEFGTFIKNELNIKEDIVHISVLNDENKYMFIVYDDGALAKIDTKVYRTSNNRRVLINSLRKDAKVCFMTAIPTDLNYQLTTTKRVINRSTNMLTPKACRNTKGARAFNGVTEKFISINLTNI